MKQFLRAVLAGIDPPRVIVFIDEIEKAFAGTGTDLSGVKTEMVGTMLTWMQDCEAEGMILLGPPGSASRIQPNRGRPELAFRVLSDWWDKTHPLHGRREYISQ